MTVLNTPGVWYFSHNSHTLRNTRIRRETSWLDPYDSDAFDYAEALPYGMLEALREHITRYTPRRTA